MSASECIRFLRRASGSVAALDRVVLILLTISVMMNASFAATVLTLVKRARPIPEAHNASLGRTVSPLTVYRLDGAKETLSFSSQARSTVLYFMSPSCGWCALNRANVQSLARQASRSFRFVAVSSPPFPAGHSDLGFDIRILQDWNILRSYGVRGTPHTLVVSPTGRISQSWAGAYEGLVGQEVQTYFGVRLPGLTPDTHRELGGEAGHERD